MLISNIMVMPHKLKPEHFTELNMVVTLAQAVREYGIRRETLTYAIDAQNIAAMRCGKSVIISRRSLEQYYFTPAKR